MGDHGQSHPDRGIYLIMAEKRMTAAQRRYLQRGVDQPGGKLPLFDEQGQAINPRTIRACIEAGLAQPWFHNPLKPEWLVCKLTDKGRDAVIKM